MKIFNIFPPFVRGKCPSNSITNNFVNDLDSVIIYVFFLICVGRQAFLLTHIYWYISLISFYLCLQMGILDKQNSETKSIIIMKRLMIPSRINRLLICSKSTLLIGLKHFLFSNSRKETTRTTKKSVLYARKSLFSLLCFALFCPLLTMGTISIQFSEKVFNTRVRNKTKSNTWLIAHFIPWCVCVLCGYILMRGL